MEHHARHTGASRYQRATHKPAPEHRREHPEGTSHGRGLKSESRSPKTERRPKTEIRTSLLLGAAMQGQSAG
jgi:hypothetical protein